ncbi:MAG: zinc ABC transporter substrate-binding protein ZnuA [Hyphomicrobiales bacterium]
MILHRLLPAAICLSLFLPVRAHAADVVVTIKPLHSIAAAVMQGAGTPRLLVSGAASPHTFALKPSDANALKSADLIVWVGEDLETALERPLESLAKPEAVLTLIDLPDMRLLEAREGGVWAEHDHGHSGHGHEKHEKHAGHGHGKKEKHHHHGHGHAHDADHHDDPHIWLDPANAKVIASALAQALSRVDPANAGLYRANAEALSARLDGLDRELAEATKPLQDMAYIVFHDAYQYFEARYGLQPAGSITVSPDRQPGARRVTEIRDAIVKRKARCVFAEPQFEPKLQQRLVETTGARAGVLDPIGAALPEGPDLYFTLMRNLAASLAACQAP